MADTLPDTEHARALAAAIGWERLTEEHLQQLARAMLASRARAKKLGSERLDYTDEPAHVFRLDERGA
jgi:hypothetical protein